ISSGSRNGPGSAALSGISGDKPSGQATALTSPTRSRIFRRVKWELVKHNVADLSVQQLVFLIRFHDSDPCAKTTVRTRPARASGSVGSASVTWSKQSKGCLRATANNLAANSRFLPPPEMNLTQDGRNSGRSDSPSSKLITDRP